MLRSDLEAEAQRLARRWIRLSAEPNGFPPVALWRGPPPSNHRLPQAGAKHLLSMDLERVPAGPVELPLSGVQTLWQAGPREATVQIHRAPILWDAAAASSAVSERKTNPYSGADMGEYVVWPDLETKAVILYAHEDTSLPAVDDLFRFV